MRLAIVRHANCGLRALKAGVVRSWRTDLWQGRRRCLNALFARQSGIAFPLQPFKIFTLDLFDARLLVSGIVINRGKPVLARFFDQLRKADIFALRALAISLVDEGFGAACRPASARRVTGISAKRPDIADCVNAARPSAVFW